MHSPLEHFQATQILTTSNLQATTLTLLLLLSSYLIFLTTSTPALHTTPINTTYSTITSLQALSGTTTQLSAHSLLLQLLLSGIITCNITGILPLTYTLTSQLLLCLMLSYIS